MTDSHNWNPEDGPPPSEHELAESKELASILATPHAGAAQNDGAKHPAAELDGLVQAAMRVRATAHTPTRDSVHAVVKSAVDSAIKTHSSQKRSRTWLRLVAVAAVAIGGITGVRVAGWGTSHPSHSVSPITRSADDVFRAALSNNPGSSPISMIDDSRIRSYRQNLFARGGRIR